MNCSVSADLPTPPLPTMMTLWSASDVWFLFFPEDMSLLRPVSPGKGRSRTQIKAVPHNRTCTQNLPLAGSPSWKLIGGTSGSGPVEETEAVKEPWAQNPVKESRTAELPGPERSSDQNQELSVSPASWKAAFKTLCCTFPPPAAAALLIGCGCQQNSPPDAPIGCLRRQSAPLSASQLSSNR